jgi:hypothetical protein
MAAAGRVEGQTAIVLIDLRSSGGQGVPKRRSRRMLRLITWPAAVAPEVLGDHRPSAQRGLSAQG